MASSSEATLAQAALSEAPGVWVVDSGGGTRFVSERMAHMLGATPDELLGVPARALLGDVEGTSTRERQG